MTRAVVTYFGMAVEDKWQRWHIGQPPRRPLKLFPKPYSWFHVRTVSLIDRFEGHHDTFIGVVFPALAEKCRLRVERDRPGHAWLSPLCSTNGRCSTGGGIQAAVTRVATRVAMRGGSGPLITTGMRSQPAPLHLAHRINNPVINRWRGRVAVLLERGCPARRRGEEAQRIRAQIVRSEISPPREAEVPRVEKNRPFHAGSITGVLNSGWPITGELS